MLRSPAVAGQFYPGQEAALRQMLDDMLPAVDAERPALGVMSPHAGYIYSGRVAAATLAAVRIPDTVVVLGPNHHGHGHPAAVFDRGSWLTPLGETAIAADLAARILEHCPMTAVDTTAHKYEHSLEVQLPFLQRLSPGVRIVPICIGQLPLPVLLDMGSGLAAALRADDSRTLIVASSDMTHYESGETARRKDFLALDRVLALDPAGLHETVKSRSISMCGVLPAVIMLQAAVDLGAHTAELVEYANSGDVTGDQSNVVGYAGVRVL